MFNPATAIINLFKKLGWAWDLKKPDASLIERTLKTSGNPQLRYSVGLCRSLSEWFFGLATITSPMWGMYVGKYIYLAIYWQYYDTPWVFDVPTVLAFFARLGVSIWNVGENILK